MLHKVFTRATCIHIPIARCFSTANKPNIEGIYAPIITPFNGEEHAYELLKFNISKLVKTNLRGIVVLGSNGEFPLLTKDEKLKVLEAALDSRGDKQLIAGTGCVSTKETIELTNAAAKMGYTAAMVVTPYYYTSRMSSAVLKAHFTAVADASEIPIILYNVPPFASVTMPVDLVCELSKHKNIIGVKDTTGSVVQISETSRNAAPSFTILAGSAGYLLQSMASGAQGGVMALANILPDECCTLFEYIKKVILRRLFICKRSW